ncbi:VIT1/CCC1 transporter family protein [Calorimonas adulescens]|jgi:Rubrerythrin./VIT family.|nr:VIT1/CCC1 transporter family protein [Calorimonas adulescens]
MNEIEMALGFYKEEFNAAKLYSYLSQIEKDEENKKKFNELYQIEAEHVKFWYKFLKDRGYTLSERVSSFSLIWSKFLRSILGPRLYTSFLEMTESTSTETYYEFLTSVEMSDTERENLKKIIEDELDHENFFEGVQNALPVGNIRDFIMGMNDGIVELLGAVTGLSAVYPTNPLFVGINGLVVGLAGALSMAIGTFISVRSQRQVNEGIKKKMSLLFSVSKERAKRELINKLAESGMPEDMSNEVAERIGENEDSMIGLLVEESDENELRSAIFTGLAYIIGVVFPVLPYFLMGSSFSALALSALLAGLALAIVASVVSLTAGNPNIKGKIAEMVISGLGAAVVSYLFGLLVQGVFGISA